MRPAIFLFAVLVTACAERHPAPPLEVLAAWTRPADSAGTTAAYFVFVNRDTAPVSLVSESSPLAESVTLHETMEMNGMVHMMLLDAAQTIAAGDSLVLREGAKHLMVTGLRRALTGGDSLPLELHLGDGRVLKATAAVRLP